MRERKVAWILLRGASVQSLSDGVLTLSFVREGDAKGFAGNGHDQALARVLQQMLGISPQIRTVVGAPDDAASAGAMPPGRARTPGGRAGATGTCRRARMPAPARASSTRVLLRADPAAGRPRRSGAVPRATGPRRAVQRRARRSPAVPGVAIPERAVRRPVLPETVVPETVVRETVVRETAVRETAVRRTAVRRTAVRRTAVRTGAPRVRAPRSRMTRSPRMHSGAVISTPTP